MKNIIAILIISVSLLAGGAIAEDMETKAEGIAKTLSEMDKSRIMSTAPELECRGRSESGSGSALHTIVNARSLNGRVVKVISTVSHETGRAVQDEEVSMRIFLHSAHTLILIGNIRNLVSVFTIELNTLQFGHSYNTPTGGSLTTGTCTRAVAP